MDKELKREDVPLESKVRAYPPISHAEVFAFMLRVMEGEVVNSEGAKIIDNAIVGYAKEHGIVYRRQTEDL